YDVIFFFLQAEDGIRDRIVTGVQTCALPILAGRDEHGNNEFVSDIIAIIDHCNKYFEIPKIFGTLMQDSLNYGFTNPQEFIAERSEERRVGKEIIARI